VVLVIAAGEDPAPAARSAASALEQAGAGTRVVLVGESRGSSGPGAAVAEAGAGAGPFVVTLEPGARLLPGALRRLVDACDASADIGSVFPLAHEPDATGQVSRQGHRRTWFRLQPLRRPDFDARRELAAARPLPAACRIYRRAALQDVGGAAAALSTYALDLRLAERWRIACLPEFLCVSRPEEPGRVRALGRRLRRLLDLRAARRDPRSAWLRETGRSRPSLRREAWRAVREAVPFPPEGAGGKAGPRPRSFLERWRGWLEPLHGLAADRFARWPLDWGRRPVPAVGSSRIAYHLWHFPVLSQTFVRREVAALRQAGVEVVIAADGAEDEALLGDEGRRLVAGTRYTFAVPDRAVDAFRRRLARRRPFVLANAFAFVVSRRWSPRKSLDADLRVFRDALRLAALLEPERPDRLHAPWADRCAFVALVASRLLGVPFSVQARAHELHDPDYRHPLPDVFRHADVIVTNTAYNVPFIEGHLGRSGAGAGGGSARRGGPALHVIHNGLDLERFVPGAAGPSGFRGAAGEGIAEEDAARPARLLCVARLIEQKGLLELLRACGELRDRGIDAACEVIGGPEHPLYTNYLLALRREHRRLGLGERVRFLGARPFDAILAAYAAADVFVLPCVVAADGRRDVTPNAVLEAMAMALPVVSTPVGGVPELLEDGVSGVLVPPGDPSALAAALAELIADPARRRRIGEAARRRIEERFDARRTAGRFRDVFAAAPAEPRAETRPVPS
jgi:glycosyltransferase involved in cell wall biosynthesis